MRSEHDTLQTTCTCNNCGYQWEDDGENVVFTCPDCCSSDVDISNLREVTEE